MQFHDKLNEKIWEDSNLKPEVRDKLLEIANAFIEYADIPEEGVKDIVITGSSASFNYTPYSDLDLHIIVDYDSLHEDCPLVSGYLQEVKKNFNADHDIFIYEIPVELYAEDMNTPAVSNGIFSVLNNQWKKEPEPIPPTENDTAVEAKVNEYKEIIDSVTNSEEAEEVLDKLYVLRKSGLSEEGEFSTENLTFKKLRDLGYLQKLRDLKKQEVDKELSLENKMNLSKEDIRIHSLEHLIDFIKKNYPKINIIKEDFDTWYPVILIEHEDFPELEFQIGANKIKEDIYSFLTSLKGYRDLAETKAVTLDNFEEKLKDSVSRAKRTAKMMLKEGATRFYTGDDWVKALQNFVDKKETKLSKALAIIKKVKGIK